MEVSAIMNIHELAVNRTAKQKADVRARKAQEVVQRNAPQPAQGEAKDKIFIGVMTNAVQQQSETKEEAQTDKTLTGNIVDIHT